MFKKLLVMVSTLSLGLISVGSVNAQVVDTKDSTVSVNFTEDLTPVKIDSVKNFVFNANHNIEGISQAANDDISAVVIDNRGAGDGDGWILKADLAGFTKDNVSSFEGATIKLNSGKPSSSTTLDAPTVNQTIELSSVASTIATADRTVASTTAGYGTWAITWEKENVLLDVQPGASSPGNHNAIVTFTLSNTPNN